MPKLALCSSCKRQWFWDWCMDTYRYEDGEIVSSTQLEDPNTSLEVEVFQCHCGQINACMSTHPDYGSYPATKDWHDVDFDTAENSWEE